MKTMKKMRWPKISPLLLILFILPALGEELGRVSFVMKATLISRSCTVSTDSKNKMVNMGIWETGQFSVTQQSPPTVPFIINLENCGAATSGVSVTFKGTPDGHDPSLLSINGSHAAKNIGIAILDYRRNRIPLGKASNVYAAHPNDRISLIFYGQYVATAPSVKPGVANADATFSLTYQ